MIEHAENRVFMCECCPAVHHITSLVTNDYGEQVCDISAKYIPVRKWDDNAFYRFDAGSLKHRRSAIDPRLHGFCEECGDEVHPLESVTDNYGVATCAKCAVPLVDYGAIEDYC